MEVLSAVNRFDIWANLMRREETFGTLTKRDLRDAVDAVDDWIDANQGSLNTSIPQPARRELTARQKALLFMAVAARKFEVI